MSPAPRLRAVFTLHVDLAQGGQGQAACAGTAAGAQARIVGGRADGEIAGGIVALDADGLVQPADAGAVAAAARWAVITDDGVRIEIAGASRRPAPSELIARLVAPTAQDPAAERMPVSARLETADPRYGWVNHTLFIASVARHPGAAEAAIYAVE